MLSLDPQSVLDLPLDQLALLVLDDLVKTNEWNEDNYVLLAGQTQDYGMLQQRAIAEVMVWLRARGLIAKTPRQSSSAAIFVTRLGEKVLSEGPQILHAIERLQGGVHPRIQSDARAQFFLGQYEQAVFVALKAVEVRVRSLAGFGNAIIGVDLMNKAFGSAGPLVDPDATSGERQGTRDLFAGCYAVLRNPAGHREVDYDDVAEAAEAVQTASMLMRILDRVEARLATDSAVER